MTSQLPPIYVISLVRETARRENIKQRLTALGANYEFFNAVDGKTLQPSQYTHRMQTRHHFLKEGFEMTSGEIGCFMSHHNLWQKIADGANEYALVLEDDAVWDNDFADVINQVLTCKWRLGSCATFAPDWAICRGGGISNIGGAHNGMRRCVSKIRGTSNPKGRVWFGNSRGVFLRRCAILDMRRL